ncbi:MAG: hypothetical protein K2P99_03040 [Burkholderiales bacterium]|nr:hypothetical protein [Burkholderiales bacterium]
MKKKIGLIVICASIQCFADVPVTSTTDMASTYQQSAVHMDSIQNLQSLINSVNKAQTIQSQISALKNLSDFSKDPLSATNQVNSIVGNMLNDFNLRSGTSFGNLQDLIGSLSSSATATGMSLKLQQSSATQLQNISVMLQQMEAENQAIIRYRQADDALKAHQAEMSKKDDEKTANNFK